MSLNLSAHDPAELNTLAAIVTGNAGERHPLFSVRYGIAVALLESDWLRDVRAGVWDECYESGEPWHNPYRDGGTP